MAMIMIFNYFIECRTTSTSADANQPCVFPFEYAGFVFTKCTEYGAKGFWCPTKVPHGSSRKMSSQNGNKWGWCQESCPKQQKGK